MMTPVVVVLTRFKQTKPRTIDVHRRSAALDRFDVNPAAAFTAMASSGHCARIRSSRELAGANASERNHCLDVIDARMVVKAKLVTDNGLRAPAQMRAPSCSATSQSCGRFARSQRFAGVRTLRRRQQISR
jgi:hypothetical protein